MLLSQLTIGELNEIVRRVNNSKENSGNIIINFIFIVRTLYYYVNRSKIQSIANSFGLTYETFTSYDEAQVCHISEVFANRISKYLLFLSYKEIDRRIKLNIR